MDGIEVAAHENRAVLGDIDLAIRSQPQDVEAHEARMMGE